MVFLKALRAFCQAVIAHDAQAFAALTPSARQDFTLLLSAAPHMRPGAYLDAPQMRPDLTGHEHLALTASSMHLQDTANAFLAVFARNTAFQQEGLCVRLDFFFTGAGGPSRHTEMVINRESFEKSGATILDCTYDDPADLIAHMKDVEHILHTLCPTPFRQRTPYGLS